jgi:hypothetical protein
VNVEIEGKTALLSDIADIQRDPVTDKFLHVDFHEVSQTEKMATFVPLEFFGESISAKNSREVFDMARYEVSVRSLPTDSLSSIRVDISGLDVGNMIHISDLGIPSGVEIMADPATPVVSCNTIAEETVEAETVREEAPVAEETTAKPEYDLIISDSLIVGLGNPGKEYDLSRQNVGFLIVDAFADKNGLKWVLSKKHQGFVAKYFTAGRMAILPKPMTFMNESGVAVLKLCSSDKIPPQRL